jgi:hypothetical protein
MPSLTATDPQRLILARLSSVSGHGMGTALTERIAQMRTFSHSSSTNSA